MLDMWLLILVWFSWPDGEVANTHTIKFHTEIACEAERKWWERGEGLLPVGLCRKVPALESEER